MGTGLASGGSVVAGWAEGDNVVSGSMEDSNMGVASAEGGSVVAGSAEGDGAVVGSVEDSSADAGLAVGGRVAAEYTGGGVMVAGMAKGGSAKVVDSSAAGVGSVVVVGGGGGGGDVRVAELRPGLSVRATLGTVGDALLGVLIACFTRRTQSQQPRRSRLQQPRRRLAPKHGRQPVHEAIAGRASTWVREWFAERGRRGGTGQPKVDDALLHREFPSKRCSEVDGPGRCAIART
jgi:hypothetical protein